MATNLQPPVSHLGSLLAYLDYWLGAGSTGPLPSCFCQYRVMIYTTVCPKVPFIS